MRLPLSCIVPLLLLPATTTAFDGSRAKAIDGVLASDAFLGRKSGLEGGRMTEEYVAARFAEWGLEPAGDDGTYFDSFPMLVTDEKGASMSLLDGPLGEVEFTYGDDFVPLTNSGSADVTADVVFVGHGLSDRNRDYDDYGDTDVTGKIVVVFRGHPDTGYDWGRGDSRDSTVTEAVRRGAAAVLFVRGDHATAGAAIHEGSYFPEVPMASIGPRVVTDILRGTGYDRKRYDKELAEGPAPFDTGHRLRFTTEVVRIPDGEARNVVGRVTGADPKLRREIVIVGGHMDHVGVDGEGRVYNGANDNGSGTSVVMELARSFASGKKPARTIVFVTFAGEEQGLLGSIAFADDPPFDLSPAVAMINFDMDGHGDGKVGLGADSYPALVDSFRASLGSARAESLRVARTWGDASDHAPFRWEGIPVFNIWSEGDHRFYHSLDDDPEWVSEAVLGSVGRMAEAWIRTIAGRKEPLLVPHLAGRSLLEASDQVDFDGLMNGGAPPYVRGRVRWFDAGEFPRPPFIDALGDLRLRTGGDSLSIVYNLGEVHTVARSGKRSVLLGLQEADDDRVSEEHVHLLGDLNVSFARWLGGLPPDEADYFEELAGEGVALLVPAPEARADLLPAAGKSYVRFYPGRGESVAEPDSLPRKHALFVATLERREDPARIAAEIRRLGWDRVHLDLVPWIAAANERDVWPFLEELQGAGDFEPFQMRAILGGNLDRL